MIRLKPGLTKKDCEKLGREVEDHLNSLRAVSTCATIVMTSSYSTDLRLQISSRVAEAGPYRVLTHFYQALGRTPSSCRLIFNFPEGEDSLLGGFMIMDVFDKVESEERACEASLRSPAVLPDKPTPSTDAEPIKYDMHMEGKTEIWTPHYPANYDQLIMREGCTPWVLHLIKGLTKKRCESLAKEVEEHLNEEVSNCAIMVAIKSSGPTNLNLQPCSPKGNAQARTTMDDSKTDTRCAGPYRVLTLFVGEYGERHLTASSSSITPKAKILALEGSS